MTVTSMQELRDRKNGAACILCSFHHAAGLQCSRKAMELKITKLLEANSMIPAILAHNKEATDLAESYREMLKKADEAHAILLEILSAFGKVGEQIRDEYLGRLNSWATGKAPTSQDTSENQLDLFSQGQSTLSETETKNFTTPQSGEVSGGASSELTPSAIAAEHAPRL